MVSQRASPDAMIGMTVAMFVGPLVSEVFATGPVVPREVELGVCPTLENIP